MDIPAAGHAQADIKLIKTLNLPVQLTNAEWLSSMPGSWEQKARLRNCTVCHTLLRPLSSTHDAEELVDVQARMATYVNQSIPLMPQIRLAPRLANQAQVAGEDSLSHEANAVRKQAEYLASVNLSRGGDYSYPLKTFPAQGRGDARDYYGVRSSGAHTAAARCVCRFRWHGLVHLFW